MARSARPFCWCMYGTLLSTRMPRSLSVSSKLRFTNSPPPSMRHRRIIFLYWTLTKASNCLIAFLASDFSFRHWIQCPDDLSSINTIKYRYLWYDAIGRDLRSEWISSKFSLALDSDSGNDRETIFPSMQPEHTGLFLRFCIFRGKFLVHWGIFISACSFKWPRRLCQIW